MKINLIREFPYRRSGYLNLLDHPDLPDLNEPKCVFCPHDDLSDQIDDGEADEILALEVLDAFPAEDADQVLRGWLKKLAYGGQLTISVVDCSEAARGLLHGGLSAEDFSDLVYGTKKVPRRSAYQMARLVDVFTNLGYRVVGKRLQNYRAVVTVIRPWE